MGQRVRVQVGVIAAGGAIDGSVFGTVIGFGEPIISEFDGETEESRKYTIKKALSILQMLNAINTSVIV